MLGGLMGCVMSRVSNGYAGWVLPVMLMDAIGLRLPGAPGMIVRLAN